MSDALQHYSIQFCQKAELFKLQQFIDNHWKKNHALAVSKELMDWQHYDNRSDIYNFVIAKHSVTDEIHALLGFIPTSHFDNAIKEIDLWLAIWKVRDDIKVSGLGMLLLSHLIESKHPRSISAFGLSRGVIPIYKFLGYKVGILNHYFITNNRINGFNLIEYDDKNKSEILVNKHIKLIHCESSDFLQITKDFEFNFKVPKKSLKYMYKRYISHPLYDYLLYRVRKNNSIVGILVFRLATYKSNYALRVVDFFGDINGLLGSYTELQRLLYDYNAEYMDFYNIGFDEKTLKRIGFVKRTSSKSTIIPNYFEPFEKKNIDLDFAYKCDRKLNFTVCKGDSDQDRPNIL